MPWIDRLREIKGKSNLSTREIASISGIPEPTLEKLFSGQTKNPGINSIQQLVHALGHTLDDLDDHPSVKKASSGLSEEAQRIAKDYEQLTDHGKGAVKALLSYEGNSALVEEGASKESGKQPVAAFPKARRGSSGIVEIRVYAQPAAAGLGNYLDEPDFRIEQYPDGVIPSKTDFGVIISGDSMEPRVHNGGTVFVQAAPSIDPGKIGIFVLNGQAYCKKLVVDRDNRQIRLVSLNERYDDILVGDSDTFYTVGRVLGQWTPGHKQELFGW